MATPQERIRSDLKDALKAKDKVRLGTLRMLPTDLKNEKIHRGEEVDEEGFLALVRRGIKQRRDSETQFRAGGREELAEKENLEAEILAAYLPQQVGEDEIRAAVREQILVRDGDLVNVPGREANLTGEESELSRALLAAFEGEGLTPPSPQELARRLGAKPQILEGVMRYLAEQQKLVRLPSGLVLATAAIEELKEKLRDSEGWTQFSVATFKDHFGLTRKWAIPLLEHLDSVGFTRRVGDERQIVKR
jgi:uncharacterized protein YqeY